MDAGNNLRDNLTSYHDIIKTERWEMRFFGFFLGLCEADAFSSFRTFNIDGSSMSHSAFKDNLAFEMLEHCQRLKSGHTSGVLSNGRVLRSDLSHSYIPLSSDRGKRIRLVCRKCKEMGVTGTRVEKSCSCDPATPLCDACNKTHLKAVWKRHINLSGPLYL